MAYLIATHFRNVKQNGYSSANIYQKTKCKSFLVIILSFIMEVISCVFKSYLMSIPQFISWLLTFPLMQILLHICSIRRLSYLLLRICTLKPHFLHDSFRKSCVLESIIFKTHHQDINSYFSHLCNFVYIKAVVILTIAIGRLPTFSGDHPTSINYDFFRSLPISYGVFRVN